MRVNVLAVIAVMFWYGAFMAAVGMLLALGIAALGEDVLLDPAGVLMAGVAVVLVHKDSHHLTVGLIMQILTKHV